MHIQSVCVCDDAEVHEKFIANAGGMARCGRRNSIRLHPESTQSIRAHVTVVHSAPHRKHHDVWIISSEHNRSVYIYIYILYMYVCDTFTTTFADRFSMCQVSRKNKCQRGWCTMHKCIYACRSHSYAFASRIDNRPESIDKCRRAAYATTSTTTIHSRSVCTLCV